MHANPKYEVFSNGYPFTMKLSLSTSTVLHIAKTDRWAQLDISECWNLMFCIHITYMDTFHACILLTPSRRDLHGIHVPRCGSMNENIFLGGLQQLLTVTILTNGIHDIFRHC